MKRPLRILLWIFGFLLTAALGGALGLMWVWNGYVTKARGFDLSKIDEISQRSAVYDVSGNLYSYIHGENRVVVPLQRVSPLFIKALLAREDARFYQHRGLDYHGIARAAWANFRRGGVRQGGSTITQQLARNSFPLGGQTLSRKLLEAALARRIEREFPKDKILEFYINRIYYGAGLYGIETASRAYFGKPSSDLNLSESALMAGIIRSPNRNSPLANAKGALDQRDLVINRMVDLGMITPTEASGTKDTQLTVTKKRPLPYQENYAMDAVRRDLEVILSPEQIDQGGLRIYTTIDPALQEAATKIVDEQLAKIEEQPGWKHPKKSEFARGEEESSEDKPTDYLQGALIAIDNRNGAIRALVGGRDFTQSRYNRALAPARRQAGSTFKPFIYTAAFERGLLPGTLVDDSEIKPGEFRDVSNKWSPENSDGENLGLQPAALGLIKSRNTMTVRVGEMVGLSLVRQNAAQLGLGNDLPEFPVVFLGAFETTLKDLAAAYTIFPNNGMRKQAYIIARIDDFEGRTIYKASHVEARAFAEDATWMTSALLQQVMKIGTASKAKSLGWTKPAGGKTGTTNDYKDAWFVGYTASLTCGVWTGFDQPQTIMEKGYGSTLALPIWVEFMKRAPEKEYPAGEIKPPMQLLKTHLCAQSGGVATTGCDVARTSYDADLPTPRVPAARCTVHAEPVPQPVFATAPAPMPVAMPPAAPTAGVSSVPPAVVARPATMPPSPAVVQRPDGRRTVIYHAAEPSAVEREFDEPPPIEQRRAEPRVVAAEPRGVRGEIQAAPAPVPVMRAEPVRPQPQSRMALPRDEQPDEDAPAVLPQRKVVAEAEGNRPRGRVKKRIIKTRVYSDGREEQEIIEVR